MNPGRLWRRRRRVNIECGYRSCPPSRDILNALRSFVVSLRRGGRVAHLFNKESWSRGPSFGLSLKGAILLKAVQVKSA